MTTINLEKYKQAWNKEELLSNNTIQVNAIHRFMHSESTGTLTRFRRFLKFDIAFKLVLLASFVLLLTFVTVGFNTILNLLCILSLVLGGMWQGRAMGQIPAFTDNDATTLSLVQDYVRFYKHYYVRSILISALSSALFFLSGSLFYFYFKYQGIPVLQTIDILVFTLGVMISYGLSAIAQFIFGNYQINNLEKCLDELGGEGAEQEPISRYRSKILRRNVLLGILIIVGLILFGILIVRYLN